MECWFVCVKCCSLFFGDVVLRLWLMLGRWKRLEGDFGVEVCGGELVVDM